MADGPQGGPNAPQAGDLERFRANLMEFRDVFAAEFPENVPLSVVSQSALPFLPALQRVFSAFEVGNDGYCGH
jgi:hypothetical protein